MANKIKMTTFFVALVSTLTLFPTTYAATTYTVGDSTGWQFPFGNANLYDDWAENKNFIVGDILVFNFTTARHNVVEVTEPGYNACTMTDTILTVNNGPAIITLKKTGYHYFVCGYAGHCFAGQKLKIQVRKGNGNTPGVLSPPGAASSVVATMSLVFMSIAFVLLC